MRFTSRFASSKKVGFVLGAMCALLPSITFGASSGFIDLNSTSTRGERVIAIDVKTLDPSEVVPASVESVMIVNDFRKFKDGLGGLSLTDALSESSIAASITSALRTMARPKLGERLTGMMGFLRMALSTTVSSKNDAIMAVRRQVLLGSVPSANGRDAELVLVAVIGTNRRPIERYLGELVGEIIDRYPQTLQTPVEERGGAKIRGISLGEAVISYSIYENLLIIGTGQGTIARCIETHLSSEKRSLSQNDQYIASSKNIGKGAAVYYGVFAREYLNSIVTASKNTPMGYVLDASIEKVSALWGAIYFDGKSIREKMEITTPGGLPFAIGGEKLAATPVSLSFFSVDTICYMAFNDKALNIFNSVKDSPLGKLINKKIGGITNPNFVQDVLPPVLGEVAIGLSVPSGKKDAELLIVCELNDSNYDDKITEFLEKLAGRGALINHELPSGIIVKSTKPMDSVNGITSGMPLALATLTHKGKHLLLIGNTARVIKKALHQVRYEDSSLLNKKDFKTTTGTLRPNWSVVAYVDGKNTHRVYSKLATGGDYIVPNPADTKYSPKWVDLLAAITTRNTLGTSLVVDSNKSSTVIETYGSLGPVSGLIANRLWEKRLVSLPVQSNDYETERLNLKSLGLAMQLYITDFDRFPVKLSELNPEYIKSLDVFTKTPGSITDRRDIDANTSYAYISGFAPMGLSDTVILYSKEPLFGDEGVRGRNVLFIDGTVGFLEERVFQLRIKQQETWKF